MGVATTVRDTVGTLVDVTVQTGGTKGVMGADLDTLGIAETGLQYEHLYCLNIFNGGGHTTVPTSLTFSNIRLGSAHRTGLLMVGAVNGYSSPITVTSSVAGRVGTWTVVGTPFDYTPSNSWPISWDPTTGELSTTAFTGNDSRCIVLDLGGLSSDGTVTVSLNQYLDDGIVYAFGEELTGNLGVATSGEAAAIALAAPRPNPAHDGTTLEFRLARAGRARLAAYDLDGRLLNVLAEGVFPAGSHSVHWNLSDRRGSSWRPGVALIRLETSGDSRTQRLLVLR